MDRLDDDRVYERFYERPFPPDVVEAQREWNRVRSQIFATMLHSLGLVEREETDEDAIARMEGEGGPAC